MSGPPEALTGARQLPEYVQQIIDLLRRTHTGVTEQARALTGRDVPEWNEGIPGIHRIHRIHRR